MENAVNVNTDDGDLSEVLPLQNILTDTSLQHTILISVSDDLMANQNIRRVPDYW